MKNKKVIGLHKGTLLNIENKTNIGIPIELIINKISFIKCTYEIKDINKYYQIINNKDILGDKINLEIESKIRILNKGKEEELIFKNKFNEKGIHYIYFINDILLTNMSYMFYDCSSLKEINLSSFKTDNVTDMSFMFYKCSSLKEINLSSFKTDNVTDMNSMFYNCSSLKEINLSSFKTDNVTNMNSMFYNCSSLKEIHLSSFKTDNVKYMSDMFKDINSNCYLICNDNKIKQELKESINNCFIF